MPRLGAIVPGWDTGGIRKVWNQHVIELLVYFKNLNRNVHKSHYLRVHRFVIDDWMMVPLSRNFTNSHLIFILVPAISKVV